MAGALLLATLGASAHAEVIRFEVLQKSPAYDGRQFGDVGTYEKVTARATFVLDPTDPRNAVIADLDKAPRDAEGRVQATADVVLLRPSDPTRGNGTLLVDVPNRGRKIGQQLFDDAAKPNSLDTGDAGNGFLERQGYTVAWIGWQADLPTKPGELGLKSPVLAGITGPVREELIFDDDKNPGKATLQWPLADPLKLAVTVRQRWNDDRQTPPDMSVRATGAQTIEIQRPAKGYDAGALYEVTYTAKDPTVLGLAFAATRDIAAFLRRDGSAENPLALNGKPSVQHAIGFGISQSGRFLRDFLHLGFNEDLEGRMVFDGLMPHVAGGRRTAVNVRFGLPNRNARHPQDPGWQVDAFPFTYATLTDPLSGRRDGLLLRCRLNATCPVIMQTDSEIEWWSSRASLVVTDLAGNQLDLPPDVRMYMLTGTPHFSEPGESMRHRDTMALPVNPMHNGAVMRALLTDMQTWITTGKQPPSSRVPMRGQGTLVDASRAVPTNIPGLPYAGIHGLASYIDSATVPPRELGHYPVFVPLADADGISIAGIRQLAVAVPRATYTGWNPRAEGYGPSALYPLYGAAVPFAATRAQRDDNHDPRLSLQERYPSDADYVGAVQTEADRLVAERLLLPEDAKRAVDLAREDKLSQLH
ncbi:hypothetical protein CEY04_02185 [Achromobacter sp. HZ28]|nr:hypothetical protein CEY05_02185 [Achromobacter sp. HZ34]OWT82128.1 hypothetical protein CEY04_02185 [Achromobacter sp. HZ28]